MHYLHEVMAYGADLVCLSATLYSRITRPILIKFGVNVVSFIGSYPRLVLNLCSRNTNMADALTSDVEAILDV
jgi:hypothetical protein